MTLPEIKLTDTNTGLRTAITTHEPGHLRMYSCGPTVYDYAHVGNFRTFLVSDLIVRVFRASGYTVTKASNITDVGHLTNDDIADATGEDKMLKKAREKGLTPFDIAREYEQLFIEDERTLNVLPPGVYPPDGTADTDSQWRPRATEWIPQQIEMAQQLIEKEYAYAVNGSVYFRVEKYAEYGALSGNKLDQLNAGERVAVNTEKENPHDFALWKAADESHIMQWDSPWGRGFPGWHIECSVMSTQLLGGSFDLHTGGEDLIFPHHECEIAQNVCSCDATVSHWVHVKHLLVNGTKMSKSKGNFYTIRDLLAEGWTGPEIRLALLKGHYRTAANFSFDALHEARANIKTLAQAQPGDVPQKIQTDYWTALRTDLNMAKALSIAFKALAHGGKEFLETCVEPIFALNLFETAETREIPAEVQALAKARMAARNAKDWSQSDTLRDAISALGFTAKDTPDGQEITPSA